MTTLIFCLGVERCIHTKGISIVKVLNPHDFLLLVVSSFHPSSSSSINPLQINPNQVSFHLKNPTLPKLTSTLVRRTLYTMSTHRAISDLFSQAKTAADADDITTFLTYHTPEAVFMGQHIPAATGHEAIRQTLEHMRKVMKFTGEWHLESVTELGEEWAVAQVSGKGSIKFHASGKVVEEKNQGIVVLRKVGGEWKFDKGCTCSASPAPAM